MTATDEALIEALLSFRQTPQGTPIKTSPVSSNEKNPIQAYAKIQGKDWQYYVQKLTISLGRSNSEGEQVKVDIPLGDSKLISREHAQIQFNFVSRKWELLCKGRNGIRINGKYFPGDCTPIELSSQMLLDIGGICFYFLLPLQSDSSTPSTSNSEIVSPNLSKPLTPIDREFHEELNSLDEKPPFSYATLIAEAINSTKEKKMTLSGIYQYICEHYPYYQRTKNGWQNSIRHNLSLNKAFKKVPRALHEPGKGMFWIVDPEYHHIFEQGGRRRFAKLISAKIGSKTEKPNGEIEAIPDSTKLFKSLPSHFFQLKDMDAIPREDESVSPNLSTISTQDSEPR